MFSLVFILIVMHSYNAQFLYFCFNNHYLKMRKNLVEERKRNLLGLQSVCAFLLLILDNSSTEHSTPSPLPTQSVLIAREGEEQEKLTYTQVCQVAADTFSSVKISKVPVCTFFWYYSYFTALHCIV